MIAEEQAPCQSADQTVAVLVWDVSVRLSHWLIVLLVLLSWVTAENGWLAWHRFSGYMALNVVIFRVYWGFFGSSTARFVHFVRGPKVVWSYMRTLCSRGRQHSGLGHNPLGGWNVVGLLFVLLLLAGSGLFAVDVDGLGSGPLAAHVSFEAGRQIAALHRTVFGILRLLIGIHIAAVLIHLLYRRENLITPMLTGIKQLPPAPERMLGLAPPWRALLGLAASILLVLIVAFGL